MVEPCHSTCEVKLKDICNVFFANPHQSQQKYACQDTEHVLTTARFVPPCYHLLMRPQGTYRLLNQSWTGERWPSLQRCSYCSDSCSSSLPAEGLQYRRTQPLCHRLSCTRPVPSHDVQVEANIDRSFPAALLHGLSLSLLHVAASMQCVSFKTTCCIRTPSSCLGVCCLVDMQQQEGFVD